ncbi:hypothetical protein OHC33_004199 [Knufia fluminis]|uniref:Uncharacterized protein n=1 Tax=Knufia fluminis TaxID=191047 RepID=A0AAN8EMR7_9EURO|nr:hypothetical protein OHC33_004199 [Knufia fluminis]
MSNIRNLPNVVPFKNVPLSLPLQVNYFPSVALFHTDAAELNSNNSVKRLLCRNALQEAQRQSDRLRWKVVTHTSLKLLPLATQRNRLRRRWSSAIVAALRKHHLDAYGRLLKNTGMGQMQAAQELGGTFEVMVHHAHGFDLEPTVLQNHADLVVDALMKSGLGTRRINSNELRRLNKSVSTPAVGPITPRSRENNRAKQKPFNPSMYRPSWYTDKRTHEEG